MKLQKLKKLGRSMAMPKKGGLLKTLKSSGRYVARGAVPRIPIKGLKGKLLSKIYV